MIKINDDFEFERADQCWELHHWKDGINPKTKEPTRTKTTTFHGTALQVRNAVIDRSSGKADGIEGLKRVIEQGLKELTELLTKHKPKDIKNDTVSD